jgi:putative PIN family toxin of toxin-antitoxin system
VRVVLDSNVVVSALIWGGVPYRLIQAASAGDITLFASTVLLDELRDTLARPHLAARLVQQRSSVEQALGFYGQLVANVIPLTLAPTSRDPDDDHVIACALAAKAQLIVSGDRDLLVLENVRDIAIVTPAQAITRIEAPANRDRGRW